MNSLHKLAADNAALLSRAGDERTHLNGQLQGELDALSGKIGQAQGSPGMLLLDGAKAASYTANIERAGRVGRHLAGQGE